MLLYYCATIICYYAMPMHCYTRGGHAAVLNLAEPPPGQRPTARRSLLGGTARPQATLGTTAMFARSTRWRGGETTAGGLGSIRRTGRSGSGSGPSRCGSTSRSGSGALRRGCGGDHGGRRTSGGAARDFEFARGAESRQGAYCGGVRVMCCIAVQVQCKYIASYRLVSGESRAAESCRGGWPQPCSVSVRVIVSVNVSVV